MKIIVALGAWREWTEAARAKEDTDRRVFLLRLRELVVDGVRRLLRTLGKGMCRRKKRELYPRTQTEERRCKGGGEGSSERATATLALAAAMMVAGVMKTRRVIGKKMKEMVMRVIREERSGRRIGMARKRGREDTAL
jgi:hypothetical protein